MTPIAIIGIGCRFPGAHGPAEFWRLLREGRSAISAAPADRWEHSPLLPVNRFGGFIPDIDCFDADFFGISPQEAREMDPQQRIMLETVWETLEDAAIDPSQLAGTNTGVFIGLSSLNYGSMLHLHPQFIGPHANTGTVGAIIANRASYQFDFRGPSFTVDCACASSLLAVLLACQSIWSKQCAMAIAGGVNAMLVPGPTIAMERSGTLSRGQIYRVFDAEADGCMRGEGAGAVLLKPLPQALTDGDPIYAVIRGGAANQNGRGNGLTGPSRWAQESLIRQACDHAQITAAQVQYIETHSVGNPIGDATELAALAGVLGKDGGTDQPCAIGSVKPNIGHLEAAAGIASVIKTALMLRNARLIPTLNCARSNPYAKLDPSVLRVQTADAPWPTSGSVRIAGVSAAGFGGANVHLILSEAPDRGDHTGSTDAGPWRLALSAKSPQGLTELVERYIHFIDQNPDVCAADLCHTVNSGRARLPRRLTVIADDLAGLRAQLARRVPAQEGAAAPYAGARRIHGLPTYPFQRKRFWFDDVSQPELLSTGTAPPNDLQGQLARIWQEILRAPSVGTDQSFFDLGGTSALALQMFARIEREFGTTLPLATLYGGCTIQKLASILSGKTKATWEPIVALNRSPGRRPLFLVPGLGGHAFDLRALSVALGDDQPVYVLHPQGLDPAAVPLTSIEQIAAAFVGHVRSVQPLGPYQLGGYSFGGSVAFEMSRQFESLGQPVSLLALLDAYAPQAFRKRWVGRRLLTHAGRLWRLKPSQRRQYLKDRIERIWDRINVAATGRKSTDQPAGDSQIVDAVVRVAEANRIAWQTYKPSLYRGSAVLFRARPRDKTIEMFCDSDPANGWRSYVTGGVDIVQLPGDHLELFESASLMCLATELRRRLAESILRKAS